MNVFVVSRNNVAVFHDAHKNFALSYDSQQDISLSKSN